MKRLKALIKMELKPALFIGAYFLLINLGALFIVQSQIQNAQRSFLIDGIEDFLVYSRGLRMSDAFIENALYIMLLSIVGMLILVYGSFRNDKSIEIGRFLKSLPYTTKERCLTKIGVGVGTFTITYLVYAVGMIVLNKSYLNKFREFYEVTILSEVYTQIFDKLELVKVLGLVYVGCIAIYLFCVMFQYLVSHRLGSVIIAALVYVSPVFIVNSLSAYVGVRYTNMIYEKILYPLTEWINQLMIVFEYIGWGKIGTTINLSDDYIFSYSYIDLIGYRLVFYGIIALISLLIILRLCKLESIEKSDYLIPSKVFRGIFTCGVTICGALLVGDIYCMYSNEMNKSTMYGLLIVGGIISFLVAKKIATIGMRKRKEAHV